MANLNPGRPYLPGLICSLFKDVDGKGTVTVQFKMYGKEIFTTSAGSREDITQLLAAMHNAVLTVKPFTVFDEDP